MGKIAFTYRHPLSTVLNRVELGRERRVRIKVTFFFFFFNSISIPVAEATYTSTDRPVYLAHS